MQKEKDKLKAADIISYYIENAEIQAFAKEIEESEFEKFHLKGLVGSQSAFMVAALHKNMKKPYLVILNDREDALYFHTDLQMLLPKSDILYFPASSKRPYQIEQIDNANVLTRAEVLNVLNHSKNKNPIIVTCAEALFERVINRKSLVKNTLEIKEGESCGMDFLVQMLDEYGFEREDFVYEPGQFAMRGGILDIYSFAHELPFRIEFFGEDIESIRTFDPTTQISETKVKRISLIPNIHTNFLKEEKVSLLEYISPKTLIFTASIDFIQTDLDRVFEKAKEHYQRILDNSGGVAASKAPEFLYLNGAAFLQELRTFSVVEFGSQMYFRKIKNTLQWKGSAQPLFHKAFELIVEHFHANYKNKIETFVFSDNENQFIRLKEIFVAIKTKNVVNKKDDWEIEEEAESRRENEHPFMPTEGEIHEGFIDTKLNIACYSDHQIFDRYHKYKSKSSSKSSEALSIKELRGLKSGDYVTHVNHGIGQFAGLHKIKVGENTQEAIKIIFLNDDEVLVPVSSLHKVSKFVGKEGTPPKLSKLGSQTWEKAKQKAKEGIKKVAFDLVELYAKRRAKKGFAFTRDSYLQQELESSFMFEDTPDQTKVTEEVKTDMEKAYPMDRLVCGDVGFGKTEIAVRAAFKAACDGKQVAILVPTTILALQHYKSFRERLRNFPVTVDYVNRFKTTKEINETLQNVMVGKVDILIGTHRIVSKDVVFKDLGLLIIDEEQRFGVETKDKLKNMKVNVDTLTLTATPIPRTLQFSLTGIRDLSIISTPPPNRQPIETIVTPFDAIKLRDAVSYELKRGGQVFVINPRIEESKGQGFSLVQLADTIQKLVPDARIRTAHGQMGGEKLEDVMTAFIEHEFDVLVSTTIVESGLDISNANTIIINEATKYGLSELHQMRGRVGRSNRKAFCYLISPPEYMMTSDAKKRMKAMEDFSDLGSGFHIALRDLDIRGSGDLFGGNQTGFVAEVGAEMYYKILDEVINELKESHFADLFEEEIKKRKQILVEDVQIDLDFNIRIPDNYIPAVSERLNFYRKIAFATSEEEFQKIQRELIDRFGMLPAEVLNLFDTTRIREAAKRCGLERVIMKGKQLRLYLIGNQESEFYKGKHFDNLMEYIGWYSGKISIKQTPKGGYLLREDIHSVKDVLQAVEELRDFISKQ